MLKTEKKKKKTFDPPMNSVIRAGISCGCGSNTFFPINPAGCSRKEPGNNHQKNATLLQKTDKYIPASGSTFQRNIL